MKLLKYLWPLPYTLVGLLAAPVALLTGGEVRCRDGCVEIVFYRGYRLALKTGFSAFTLGHVIIGMGEAVHYLRSHEHAHVRQYERWGALFVPAYLLASAYAWVTGRDYYYDNVFEVQAHREEDQD